MDRKYGSGKLREQVQVSILDKEEFDRAIAVIIKARPKLKNRSGVVRTVVREAANKCMINAALFGDVT